MNRFLIVISSLCGLLIAGCTSMSQAGQKAVARPGGPTYVCLFTAEPPRIDGKLDDPVWQRAQPVQLRLTDTGGAPRQPTPVRALWDKDNLYIAFDCTDDDIWADRTEHDSHIFKQEVVEVFINENSDGRSYVELEVSPNNTVLDMYILNPGGGRKSKGLFDYEIDGLKTAVVVDGTLSDAPAKGPKNDRRWTVEMAIPFNELILAPNHPPRTGDRMRWNLYRIDRPGEGFGPDEYSAWSPTGKINYHVPERFGWLVFAQ